MEKTQRNNIMLAFFTLLAVIVIVSIIGFFTLGKGPEIIQGQAEATEYRVSSKVPGRILKFFVSEGDKVKAGDTLAILEAPDVMAKLSQAQAAEQAAQALNEKAPERYKKRATAGCIRNVAESQSRTGDCRKIIQPCEPPVRRRSNDRTEKR